MPKFLPGTVVLVKDYGEYCDDFFAVVEREFSLKTTPHNSVKVKLGATGRLLTIQENHLTIPGTLTTWQIAEALGLQPQTIIKAIRRGKLVATKPGRDYVITNDDARKWILGRRKK